MSLDARATWDELLASDPGSAGVLRRRVFPEGSVDIFLGVTWPGRNRLLALDVESGAADELGEPPATRAMRASVVHLDGGRSEIRVELASPEMLEVFAPFVEDVAECAALQADDRAAVEALVDRFDRWRLLLAGVPMSALGPSEAQGLWGELWVLRDALHPRLGDRVLDTWTAGDADDKDFRLGQVSIEVKTTRSGRPQAVLINGELQLEPPPSDGALLLAVVGADVHEGGTGETLSEAVGAARGLFSGPAAARFDDLLARRGYRDEHEAAYRSTRYAARSTVWHEVVPGFPRIVSGDLPDGVGDVHYMLAVDACAAWRVGDTELDALLGTPPEPVS